MIFINRLQATEEYKQALKLGQKECKERQQLKLNPHPAVLDELLEGAVPDATVSVGTVEVPAERIVGVRSAGRVAAFSAGFFPLLAADTEFAAKWVSLCEAHLGDEGIRDPVECFEYLGEFYVQEGNKRVSVLKHFGAARIPCVVRRIMPTPSDSPEYRAYLEFLDFYKRTESYAIRFTRPGGYARLTLAAGFQPDEVWPEEARRQLRICFRYFREAFCALGGAQLGVQPEEALLLWLQLHSYQELGSLSAAELKKTLSAMWENITALADPEPVVRTDPPEGGNLLTKLIAPTHVNVAFVHQRTAETSVWTADHEGGRAYLEEAVGKAVTARSYFNANTAEQADDILEQAVADGADVVFTTTPQLIAPSLKASIAHPKVRFLNCSVHMPYSTVRTYYSRIHEAKFITGAIAGAMSQDGNIGYVGSAPTYGVPASINAFALGALMTNPNATIHLKWSCLPGNPTQEFLDSGIRVISNRDAYSTDRRHHEYGTYMANDDHILVPLATPYWDWGRFYEGVIRSILSGKWDAEKPGQAVNHWWGMSSGVIDVCFAQSLPEGIRALAQLLRDELRAGTLDPFLRRIVAQDGTLKNDGTQTFTPDDLLHMDWLCENVRGRIPDFEELLPNARPTVRFLGIHPEQIPTEEVPL